MNYFPVNDDDISGSMSNIQAGNSDVHGIVAHDGNGMDLDPVPYTEPEPGQASQALYPTIHVRPKSTSCSPRRTPLAPVYLMLGSHRNHNR